MKGITEYSQFDALDIRVGRVIDVADAATRKPTYRMTIDFGPEVGVKVSCGAYRNYSKDALMGQQVVAVVNFPPLQMGPERSEVLVLGVSNPSGGTIYLTLESAVAPGGVVF